MSADNGIYIVKFPDGYRVTYAMAIDNIDYFPIGSKERKQELKTYFGDSKIFATLEDAYSEAFKMEKQFRESEDCIYLEYGICYLGEYETFINENN